MSTSQIKGGQLRNLRLRSEYLANPNLCLFCSKAILPRDGEKPKIARKKKYCDRKCSGRHRFNMGVFGPAIAPPKRKPCRSCGLKPRRKGRLTCEDCFAVYLNRLAGLTKREAGHRRIRGYAGTVMLGVPRVCSACGYARHAEIAHKRPVSDFPPDATVGEISARDNLVMLCPNCHWEFDHGTLSV